MTKIKLTLEVFKTLKAGDVISNKQDFKGGPAGYDYDIVEGYAVRNNRGCVKISIVFGKDDKYHGEPYYLYEDQLCECLGLYKKQL